MSAHPVFDLVNRSMGLVKGGAILKGGASGAGVVVVGSGRDEAGGHWSMGEWPLEEGRGR